MRSALEEGHRAGRPVGRRLQLRAPSPGPSCHGATDARVPRGLPDGACVVRVVAARNFSINIAIVPVWKRVSVSTSVARYERMDTVTPCT